MSVLTGCATNTFKILSIGFNSRQRKNNKPKITKNIKPFLKWAGGKSQLLPILRQYYPFTDGNITKYAEPFIGGGAVLFDILNNFNLEKIYISDTNKELITTYKIIRDDINELVTRLHDLQDKFNSKNQAERKNFYNTQRDLFNKLKFFGDKSDELTLAAIMIFLNKTCFNGLFRVNKKGFFNVPMGNYKAPTICEEKNLLSVSERLKNINIVFGDYKKSLDFIDNRTFVYFDPPYRPISNTAKFISYTENSFDDTKQVELSKFVRTIDLKGAKFLVSNSDPKNSDPKDNFFENIYSGYKITHVSANRMINCDGKSRNKISELLISNF